MALVFDSRNVEIKFFANNVPGGDVKKELIIYPVLAHKIHAPVIEDLQVNIFQKYILSILNKGNFSLEKISEWLSLDILLVKTIAVELANKSLLDINTLSLSTKGKEIIENTFSWFNNLENIKKDTRYILQDVFTHEIYPVVLPFESFKENAYLKNGQLHIGTKGKSDSYNYNLINPKRNNLKRIRRPETDEVLLAIEKHSKKYIPNSKGDLKKIPNAVMYFDEDPDLIYCATWMYSEKNTTNEENIQVLDPFNVYEETYWLKNNILKAKTQSSALEDVIRNLVYNLEEEDKIKASEFMEVFKIELERDINQLFDYKLKTEYHTLYSALTEYLFDIKFYNVYKDVAHLKNSFRKSQIVLETLFKIIYEEYKEDYDEILINHTYNGSQLKVYRDEIKSKIASINMHAVTPKEEYPSYWRFTEFNDVGNALRNPDSASLRALYIAAIMASHYNNENPLYNILKGKNDLSICIEKIAVSRNKFGHKYIDIPEDKIDKYLEDALIVQKDIEEIIQLFLKK